MDLIESMILLSMRLSGEQQEIKNEMVHGWLLGFR